MELGPTKYDDIDFHESSAIEAGQPRENAFTHIGLYLAWMIRRDLHAPGFFDPGHVDAVRSGEMTGSDLADETDGKLLSDLMSPEGQAFSDACYGRYLEEYNKLFADAADYAVDDDAAAFGRVEPTLDRLYADWVTAGRSAPEPREPTPDELGLDAWLGAASVSGAEIGAATGGPIGIEILPEGGYVVRHPEIPHDAPELEALVPADLVARPVGMSSTTASHWGSSLLNRALKRLDVRPRDAMVAAGLGGTGTGTLCITLYRVPGATADRLAAEFESAIFRPTGSKWTRRVVRARTVTWAQGHLVAGEPLVVAFWAVDELVTSVAGPPADVEAAIPLLP